MINQQNSITPSPELVQQWFKQAHESADPDNQLSYYDFIATAAAQWGADQELNACCEWQKYHLHSGTQLNKQLRTARRPKPLSEADQALAALDIAPKAGEPTITVDVDQYDTILRALQRLKELEGLAND
jgi:hypothetical protein